MHVTNSLCFFDPSCRRKNRESFSFRSFRVRPASRFVVGAHPSAQRRARFLGRNLECEERCGVPRTWRRDRGLEGKGKMFGKSLEAFGFCGGGSVEGVLWRGFCGGGFVEGVLWRGRSLKFWCCKILKFYLNFSRIATKSPDRFVTWATLLSKDT